MAQLTVQIVTPDGLVYDHHASFVSVRTLDGEMGILPRHENMIAVLAVDEVKVKRIDDEDHVNWIAVNGGVIEIANNTITIVADSAERARDIDVSRAERAKLRAERVRRLHCNVPLTVLMSEKDYKKKMNLSYQVHFLCFLKEQN